MFNTTHFTDPNEIIIGNYINALVARANQQGDGALGYAMGFLFNTMVALKHQGYELDNIKKDTKALEALAREHRA